MESEIGDDESVSTAVLRAVSAVTGRKPGSLGSLADVIDPDALDTLFEPLSNGVSRTGGRVSFNYSRCRITIDNGEFLTIEPFDTTGVGSAQSPGPERADRARSDRESQLTASNRTPGSRICHVCQQPIEPANLQRVRGELVHLECGAELRCGISFDPSAERYE